jgi:hypothetical protein
MKKRASRLAAVLLVAGMAQGVKLSVHPAPEDIINWIVLKEVL